MPDESKFPARRGPASDGYRQLFIAVHAELGKTDGRRRGRTAAQETSRPASPRRAPRKPPQAVPH